MVRATGSGPAACGTGRARLDVGLGTKWCGSGTDSEAGDVVLADGQDCLLVCHCTGISGTLLFSHPHMLTTPRAIISHWAGYLSLSITPAVDCLQLYTQLHYIPLYFLAIPGSSPTSSGMHLLPLLFALLAASVAASNAIMRTNRYQRILAAGLALVTLTCGIATQLDLTGNTTSAGLRDGLLLLNGVGHGCILNSLNLTPLANAHSSTEQAGGDGLAHAAAAYSFLRALGTCLAICICGPVFETLLLHRLTQFQLPAPIAQHSIEFAIQLQTLPDSWVSKRQVKISYLYSLRGVFGLLAAGAGIALLVCLALMHRTLDEAVTPTRSHRRSASMRVALRGDAGDSKTPRTPDARFDRLPKSPTAEWNWRPQGPVEERPRS